MLILYPGGKPHITASAKSPDPCHWQAHIICSFSDLYPYWNSHNGGTTQNIVQPHFYDNDLS